MKKILLPLMSLAALQLAYSGPAYSGQYMPESDGLVVPLDGHQGNKPEKIEICHVSEEDGTEKTILVSERAAKGHLEAREGHASDYRGKCGE